MALMAGATVGFIVMQTLVRQMGSEMHPFEVAFFRNLFGLFALTPLFMRHGAAPLRTRRLGRHALRSLIQSVGMLAFFTGITLIPLTQVTALSFSAPLFGSLLAVLFLGERVRIRRITALACGFLGVLIVVRPGFAAVNLGTILIIVSSLSWGTAIVLIKSMSDTETSPTLTAYMGIFMSVLTLVPALAVWQWPTAEQFGWFVVIGIAGTLAHLGFAQALRLAEATAVLPLDFLRLLWASVVGYIVFAELPDLWAWIGGSVIFGSATYIAYREARLARAARAEQRA